MCGCNSSINSFLCYWALTLNGDDEKKYSIRMHTYEQMREERERPVYSITAYYYINYHVGDTRFFFEKKMYGIEQNFNRICFNYGRLFAFDVTVNEKKVIIIFILHQSKGQYWSVTLYH
jgi:hypothetical protein